MRRAPMILMLLILSSLFPMVRTDPASAASPDWQQTAPAAASSMEVQVGLGIENLELTGASDSFKVAADTKIYGWARLKNVAPGSSIVMAFKKGEKEVYRKEVSVPSVPYRIHTYRTFRSGDSGDWTLVVSGADGKELASTPFKVGITK